jgi:regulatory protein
MDSDLYEKLLSAAFRFVSYRPRSRHEISGYLSRYLKRHKKEDPDLLEKILLRLTDLGYVDDVKFTVWLISSRRSNKPKGMRVIKNELKAKGVERQTVEEISGNINRYRQDNAAGETEYEIALKAVTPKLRIWRKFPVLDRKKKIYGFLMRRGFDNDTAVSVIDEVCGKDYNSGE